MRGLDLPRAEPPAPQSPFTPGLNVSMVAEAVFCPRAGLLAYQLNELDTGRERDDQRSPRWDHLPDYDERKINEALAQHWQEVWKACHVLLGLTLACVAIYFAFDGLLAAFLSLAPLYVAHWIIGRFPDIATLHRRRQAAARVKAEDTLSIADLGQEERTVDYWRLKKYVCKGHPDTPDDDSDHIVNVYKPQEAHRDPELQLSGRPFRILQYRSYRIPVFLKRRGKRQVFPQNRARIAAYCHLIETTERAQAPFGILMFGDDSYDVIVVPNSEKNQSLFRHGLQQARQVITTVEAGQQIDPPTGNECSGCHWGYPRVHRPGVTDAHLKGPSGCLTPFRGADGRKYHSICGDRFEWHPAHDRLKENLRGCR